MKTILLAGAALGLTGTAVSQDYSYAGSDGPGNWGGVCATGIQQSPIDISMAVEAEGIMPAIAWTQADSIELTRNNLNFTANTDAGALILNGTRYDLIQFHFHALSEHTVHGEAYPLEVHFVHASEDGNLAVVGVFYEEGEENAELAALWNAIPAAGETGNVEGLELTNFLPPSLDGYRYSGSLTTPPCAEIVAWTVLSEPLEASEAQIEAYQGLFGDTARPVQPHNRRFVLEND